MEFQSYTPSEVSARGRDLYEEQLKAKLEPGNKGKVLLIDIETGDYEMDDDQVVALDRVQARHPNAVLYGMRIGYPAMGRIGGWGNPNPCTLVGSPRTERSLFALR